MRDVPGRTELHADGSELRVRHLQPPDLHEPRLSMRRGKRRLRPCAGVRDVHSRRGLRRRQPHVRDMRQDDVRGAGTDVRLGERPVRRHSPVRELSRGRELHGRRVRQGSAGCAALPDGRGRVRRAPGCVRCRRAVRELRGRPRLRQGELLHPEDRDRGVRGRRLWDGRGWLRGHPAVSRHVCGLVGLLRRRVLHPEDRDRGVRGRRMRDGRGRMRGHAAVSRCVRGIVGLLRRRVLHPEDRDRGVCGGRLRDGRGRLRRHDRLPGHLRCVRQVPGERMLRTRGGALSGEDVRDGRGWLRRHHLLWELPVRGGVHGERLHAVRTARLHDHRVRARGHGLRCGDPELRAGVR